jgi:hypothetical protein
VSLWTKQLKPCLNSRNRFNSESNQHAERLPVASVQKTASVFDILYADVGRLSSLLSQFSDDGLVTEINRATSETSSSDFGLSVKVIKSDSAESETTSFWKACSNRFICFTGNVEIAHYEAPHIKERYSKRAASRQSS